MAGTIGPSSKLPGDRLPFVPDGTPCDRGDAEAEFHVVGETDSFGSETMHLCKKHFAELQADLLRTKSELHICEFCKCERTNVSEFRDPEEGTCGPVYKVCPDCRRKAIARMIDDDDDDD